MYKYNSFNKIHEKPNKIPVSLLKKSVSCPDKLQYEVISSKSDIDKFNDTSALPFLIKEDNNTVKRPRRFRRKKFLTNPNKTLKPDATKTTTRKSKYSKYSPAEEDYIMSYERMGIHIEMIKDEVRTGTYKDAMCNNEHLFKDKIVLDVGCGTGVLSVFAAKAGAALVIGVDVSNVINTAQEFVNSQSSDISSRIIFIKCKIEDITELPKGVEYVDIIISEWMGYCLLFESMLETVLYARDKWLKDDGLIFPDKVSLYIAGFEARQKRDERYNYWQNVHGFDLSKMREFYNKLAVVDNVDSRKVVTSDYLLIEFDLYTVEQRDLKEFTVYFELGAIDEHEIQAFVTFFTVEFTNCLPPLSFSTSMDHPPTHWKQTVFYMEDTILMKKSEYIIGYFSMRQCPENRRKLDFVIEVWFEGHYMNYKEKYFFALR